MRRRVTRIAIGGAALMLPLLGLVNALAANRASTEESWPQILEVTRRQPWLTLVLVTGICILLELLIFFGQDRGVEAHEVRFGEYTLHVSHGRAELVPTASTAQADQLASAQRQISSTPARNINFVGRDELLREMREHLVGEKAIAIRALRGLGGVGKTQLAIEYAHRYSGEYDIVWWISAEQPALISTALIELATLLDISTGDASSTVRQVLAELRHRNRWLLIFDNAEQPTDVVPYMPSGAGHVIVTSRRPGWEALGGTMHVDVLRRAESIALLARRTGLEDLVAAGTIADLMGDLPLAIDQGAAYIEETGISPTHYLELLRSRGDELISRGRPARHDDTVATVWALSMDKVERDSPAAGALLKICAYLSPDPIPLDLFTTNVSHLPAKLRGVARDRLHFTDAVGLLAAYSLVHRSGDDAIILHRLVQAAIRRRLAPRSRTASWATALRVLAADAPVEVLSRPESWRRWQQLIPHIMAIVDPDKPALKDGRNLKDLRWILDRAIAYLQMHGHPGAAIPLLRRAVAIAELTYGKDHPIVVIRLNNLTTTLDELDRSNRGHRWPERSPTALA